MATDYTHPKRYLYYVETKGDYFTLLDCPTCHNPMAVDNVFYDYAIDRDGIPARERRVAQFSHTVAKCRGGKEGALECDRCNEGRGDETDWVPPAGVRIVRQGKRPAEQKEALGAYEVAVAAARAWQRGE